MNRTDQALDSSKET